MIDGAQSLLSNINSKIAVDVLFLSANDIINNW